MISPLTLGTMEFGSKVDETEASQLLENAVDAGVNAVDTADVYASGRSEEILGRLIGAKRDL
jgi:aryl-alcohol dehydrogenase-like predicted oxidoreductase